MGERSAVVWLLEKGAAVFMPLGHSRDIDLVAVWHGCVERVQVKTSACFRNGRWVVAVCTRGGNGAVS